MLLYVHSDAKRRCHPYVSKVGNSILKVLISTLMEIMYNGVGNPLKQRKKHHSRALSGKEYEMEATLTLAEKLNDERKRRNLTLEQVAEQTGVSRAALGKYENTDEIPKDVSPYNLEKLARFYGVSIDYLMGITEQRDHPYTPIESLHLSDDAIRTLQEGGFNHRLLSELITNEYFTRLMVDLEIYVDGHVSARIRDLNAALQQVRDALEMRFHPDENDPHFRTLEIAQIDPHRYMSDVVTDDLLRIAHDLRERHKNDVNASPDTNVAEQITENAKAAIAAGGSAMEQAQRLMCMQLGIDYDKIDTLDRMALTRILKKSPSFKTSVNQRGKKS